MTSGNGSSTWTPESGRCRRARAQRKDAGGDSRSGPRFRERFGFSTGGELRAGSAGAPHRACGEARPPPRLLHRTADASGRLRRVPLEVPRLLAVAFRADSFHRRRGSWGLALSTYEDDLLGLRGSKNYNFSLQSGPLSADVSKRYERLLRYRRSGGAPPSD
jgi:hypothetical protein